MWIRGCVLWGKAASPEPAFLHPGISWQCCLLTYKNRVKWNFSRASQSLYLIKCCFYNTFHPLDFTSKLILSTGLLVEQRCRFYWQRSRKADFCGGFFCNSRGVEDGSRLLQLLFSALLLCFSAHCVLAIVFNECKTQFVGWEVCDLNRLSPAVNAGVVYFWNAADLFLPQCFKHFWAKSTLSLPGRPKRADALGGKWW